MSFGRHDPHADRRMRTARALFRLVRGARAFRQREAEIAALVPVSWKGRILYPLLCQAGFGKGPHTVNVPSAVLWSVMDLRHFHCPYHPPSWRDEAANA